MPPLCPRDLHHLLSRFRHFPHQWTFLTEGYFFPKNGFLPKMLRKEISGVSFPSREMSQGEGVWNQAMEASQSKQLQAGADVCRGSGLLLQKWHPGSQAWCCVRETQSQQPRAGRGPMEWTWVHRYWPKIGILKYHSAGTDVSVERMPS